MEPEPLRVTLEPTPRVGAPRDAVVLDIGRWLGGPAGAHQIEIALTYRRSVLGGTAGIEPAPYPDEPSVLLDVQDPARSGVAYTLLRDGRVPGVDPRQLETLRGRRGERDVIASACDALDEYFGARLRLTPDDALVARYAALRAFTPYTSTPALQTRDCFDGGGDTPGEIEQLAALNPSFTLAEAPPEPSLREEIQRRISELVGFASGGMRSAFAPDFTLEVLGGRYLPPAVAALVPDTSDGARVQGGAGIDAVNALLASGAKCASVEVEAPSSSGFRKLAFFARYVPERWDGFAGLRDARSMLVPMVATYTASGRVARVSIGAPEALRDAERINPRWPQCRAQVYAHQTEDALPAVSAPAPQAP